MNSRPAIVSIEDSTRSDGSHVVVTLDWEDHAFTGEAIGPEDGQSRLAGEATLSAVSTILGGGIAMELLALATADLGSESVALAQVRLGDGDVLVGSALERDRDPRLAAARAVMDAINRRISRVASSE
jgi:hypothetical protein